MLGAIIGDIVGSHWEFNPTNDYNFPLFTHKNGFTDDTICTIAVADAILHGSDDYGQFIHTWCRKYPYPMGGYGGRFAQWVASDHPQPYGSYGNGSAMRVSPIGWWFQTADELLEQAKKSAACTHNHAKGIKGAQAVALAIHGCRELRQAVALGADADTLGAITGSMAEALWGIPEWMKVRVLLYLPEEMKKVIREFRIRVKGL